MDMGANVFDYLLHKLGLLSIYQLHKRTKDRFFKKQSLNELAHLAERFVDERLSGLLNTKVVERLQGHCILLSSSPNFLVEPIAKRLGFSHWLATSWEPLSIVDGEAKRIEAALAAERLGIPLSNCVAYSDSHLDLPLLISVGKVVLVNPDRTLLKINVKNNWEII